MTPPPVGTPPDPCSKLARLAESASLLVVTTYDGPLAEPRPGVHRPAPRPEVQVALANLVLLPQTQVALLSGRPWSELCALTGAPPGLSILGSHGAERDARWAERHGPALLPRRQSLRAELERLLAGEPGFELEDRPASVVLHQGGAPPERARELGRALLELAKRQSGVRLRPAGRQVEFLLAEQDPAAALDELRCASRASAVLFLGDAAGSADAFARLGAGDLGLLFGPGGVPKGPADREILEGPAQAAHWLGELQRRRSAWLAGAGRTPIQDHALLSDQRAAALVDPSGAIVWCAAPRLDGPALFAALVGGQAAGSFSVRPVGAHDPPEQRYVHEALVLETRWRGLRLVDYLVASHRRSSSALAPSELVRVLDGRGEAEVVFAPRLDFGRRPTRLACDAHGISVAASDPPVRLSAPGVVWNVERGPLHDTARARVAIDFEPVALELCIGPRSERASASEQERRLATIAHWQAWSGRLALPARFAERARAGARVLRGLCFGPTGAFAAAATAGLPGLLGGTENRDRRYVWLDEAAAAAEALLALGCASEVRSFLTWVAGLFARPGSCAELGSVFAVDGSAPPALDALDLAGYAGSRPVCTGTPRGQGGQAALGALVDLAWKYALCGGALPAGVFTFVQEAVRALERAGVEEDPASTWVGRSVRAWMIADRAVRLAELQGLPAPAAWSALAAELAGRVLERGWSAERRAFTASHDPAELDASALWVGLAGLAAPEDPRFVATVETVERELRSGAVVRPRKLRGAPPAAQPGSIACATWLVEALASIGRESDALRLFEALLAQAGPSGLFAESWCPRLASALGNLPSLAAHASVVQCAVRLDARLARACAARPQSAA